MRILHISFETPSRSHGKGWRVLQSFLSLQPHGSVTYMGPAPEDPSAFGEPILMEESNRRICGWFRRFRGLPVALYDGWKKAARHADWRGYDAVFVDGSRYDFVLRRARKKDLKVLVRVHHVEQDWARALLNTDRSLRARFTLAAVCRREKRAMDMAHRLIFTTREDLDRACSLYGESLREKSLVTPICLMGPDDLEVHVNVPEKYLLATGSLDLGPNAEGIKWFIRQIWTPLRTQPHMKDVALVVAGRRPDEEMRQLCENAPDCWLVDSPPDMTPYFQHANLYVAPSLYGPGMKVKVAEALSYGLRVIGSPHALIGYTEIARFALTAQTEDDWRRLISRYVHTDGLQQRLECQWAYKDLYTIRRSAADFGRALNRIL